MKVNKSIVDGKWYDFEDDVKFKVRPIPTTSKFLFGVAEGKADPEAIAGSFMHALVDWKGLTTDGPNGIVEVSNEAIASSKK